MKKETLILLFNPISLIAIVVIVIAICSSAESCFEMYLQHKYS